MSFYLDIGCSQLNKKGEELCGDSVEILRSEKSTVIVLSDGLGSGVKANILSRITAKTAATMLKMGCLIDEVIETMAETLPVCNVRHLAYSTFSIVQIFNDGRAYLAEFDNPPAYLGYENEILPLKREERTVRDKQVKETLLDLMPGNWIVLISDGVLHAGLGNVLNFGWGDRQLGRFIKETAGQNLEANDWAEAITEKCNGLYGGLPGDDVSVVVIKIRDTRKLTVLVGPPRSRDDDRKAVGSLIRTEGRKVVCGGSTSNMVSRILLKELVIDLSSFSEDVPPTGTIEGIDLVTEGAITLYHALEMLKKGVKLRSLAGARDGASLLLAEFLRADKVHFIVGLAVNQAQHYPGFPPACLLKNQTVRDIAEILKSMGKEVTIEYL
ncbi:MAG: SpoIIE family protein phosphatase [Pelotomaculum sp.]|nr:SpoIIE family protein phosphatase [Pelotomaculum sp.]